MSKSVKAGDVVYAVVDPRMNNGDDVAPAMVTRVVDEDGEQLANLRVFLDTGADQRLVGVPIHSSRPDAEDGDVPVNASGIQRAAFHR